MSVVAKLLRFLPNSQFFSENKSVQIKQLYYDVVINVLKPLHNGCADKIDPICAKQSLVRIGVVYDLLYACLHTGEWHAVPVEEREVFTIVCYLRIIYMLICSNESTETLENAIYIADIGIMLGRNVNVFVDGNECDLLTSVASVLSKSKADKRNDEPPLKKLKIDDNCSTTDTHDIPVMFRPSMQYFGSEHYEKREPLLLRGIIDDWPAMQKWHDPNYLVGLAGERTVPVEMGSQYSSEDWSQRLVKFKDFIVDNLNIDGSEKPNQNRAYLAQHELFDQIPELRKDIHVPDYIGGTDVNPRIKAWLGPKGTISPLHTDPSHNLLCQVFGSKTIILASPEDTPNLYPHEHFILANTSRVDMRNVDYDQFPLVRAVRLRRLVLRRGEVLYIPPGWWHYVESLAPSFSVSFWFD
ncbi:lysine-specific demethylase 8 isoform X1 [Aedes aegypti]|uniref:JmjC domain-containing protein n=1 Tax=Aedes aegypti TaxID=7159 RepID=A0A6I8TAC8_AEDAE|nr:lysine-specific demethylase 8 isoform X1 [Aedes aegypti]